jgi:hypothetical protein
MIAQQRSGTHLIRHCVNSHPYALCPPEPLFHQALASDAEMQSFLAQYNDVDEHVVLIDIKYNQITDPVERWLEGQRVLHLIRRDRRRQFFSRELRRWMAEHKGEDHGYYPPEHAPQIRFDQAEYDLFYREVEQNIAYFTLLETTRLYYEDLTDNQPVEVLPAWAGRILCALLAVPYRPLTARGKKDAPTDIEGYWE